MNGFFRCPLLKYPPCCSSPRGKNQESSSSCSSNTALFFSAQQRTNEHRLFRALRFFNTLRYSARHNNERASASPLRSSTPRYSFPHKNEHPHTPLPRHHAVLLHSAVAIIITFFSSPSRHQEASNPIRSTNLCTFPSFTL